MHLIYAFTTSEAVETAQLPELAQVGGKARSLMLMARRGLPVPPGFVLTTAFFEPWLAAIQDRSEWAALLSSRPDDLQQRCAAVKSRAQQFELDAERRGQLADALACLDSGSASLLAVRSSSPEEDGEVDSFAGAYETLLGVKPDQVERAVRQAFASCLDERVLVYKKEHGYAIDKPRIAVIVQQQIASDVAGVAFSLNPINNCYDEAVINANWGLGESVVSGLVSPDSFVVDKISRTILDRKLGKKENAIWLDPHGGTRQAAALGHDQLCLSDEQVLALTDVLVEVENDYRGPVDVEWAFAGGSLYVLQARPITVYFPLPEPLLTAPGEPKKLYVDLTLIKWGMEQLVSVMGTDYLAITNEEMLRFSMGEGVTQETIDATRRTLEGRTYLVISNSIKVQGKKRVAGEFREMDALCGEIIAAIDEDEYVPKKLPAALKGLMLKMIGENLGVGWQVLRAIRDPVGYRQEYLAEEARLRSDLTLATESSGGLSTRALARLTMRRMIDYIKVFMPLLFAAIIARSRMKKLFKDDGPEVQKQLVYLERALPHNVTIEMGLMMARLARFLEIADCASGDAFAARLQARDLNPEFLAAWDAFMAKYGCRSPMEMDPAAPRFHERPAVVFDQLRTMAANTDPKQDPQVIFDRARAEREAAYQALLHLAGQKGKRKAKRFAKDYATWIDLGGYRETPKYYVSWIADLFRQHVLCVASELVAAGRLDQPQQVFDLHMDDLDRAMSDPGLDLRAAAAANTRFLRRLERVRSLPRVVDSRGKILRPPPRALGKGELSGEAISTGTARGRIKVLHRPDEKPVLPGEILVARATDPGWTPLFINASGVILEVGGMLQHGALVAREYGKPCVAGVQDATSIFHDGQMVELDGASGIVRLIEGS